MKNRVYSYLAVIISLFAFTACLEEDPNWAEGRPSPIISIEDVRDLYRGNDVMLTSDKLAGANQILGVVISDAASKNIPAGTVVIQNRRRNANRGIIIAMDPATTIPYGLGDSVVVDITGSTLTKTNGALMLTNIGLDKITKAGSNKTVKPMAVTVEKLLANPGIYEGTLVKVAGSINPTPVSGETYSGNKKLENGAFSMVLHTEPASVIANRRLPASADFTGIVIRNNASGNTTGEADVQLWMRNAADVANASGPIYAGWPENFDGIDASVKDSYNMNPLRGVVDNTITLSTGPWKLFQAILGTTANDRVVSAPNSVRIQQNLSVPGLLQMNFDVPNGATKVTAWVGSYGASGDKPAQWKLEYSQNQGATWTQIGEDMWAINKNKELITFLMDIVGPVRFRIFKYGPGDGSTNAAIQNGRLSVDNFAIYENPK